jgi:tetratricopeptide (TPR) repeat protein
MKKITILLLLVIPALTGFSQAKLVNAIKYLNDFQKNKDQESLAKAKENIDLYIQGGEIKDPAKAQKVKGQVYLALFENNLGLQRDKLANITDPNAKELTAYQNTASTAELDEAMKAFAASKAADTKGVYAAELLVSETQAYNHYYNKGIVYSNNSKLPESVDMFEKALAINDSDSTLMLLVASNSYDMKDYNKAKSTLSKMIEAKKGSPLVYNLLVQSNFNLKDTVAGIDVLKKGRAAYPSDDNLLTTETNYFLNNHKTEDALKNLEKVVASRPNDPGLYFTRGTTYDKLAHPEDKDGKALPKPANYDTWVKSAESDYKKAIELSEAKYKNLSTLQPQEATQLKEVYSQALFNLGVMYFNDGAEISKVADKITDNAKYAAENKKANEQFKKAMPFLEKSQEVSSDERTLYALKQIYTRLELTDKLKTVNAQMKN